MSCGNTSPITYTVQMFTSNNCNDCSSNCPTTLSSACVPYNGPDLSCSGVTTGDSLETALQKIDTQICSAIGDYSTYQFHCLEDWYGSSITQESQFVDAITGYACELSDNFTTFTNTTFTDYQTAVDARFVAIEVPGITCSSASVTNTDSLVTILTKYCNKFSSIDGALDISAVTWNACFSVPSAPSSIADGFNLLANQICQVKALTSGGSLPTFNNSGNCLAGGVSDSLVTTIGLITDLLCTTAVFNVSSVSWGCLDDGATNLQTGFQVIVDKVSDLTKNVTTYSGDFVVTQNDVEDPCAGISVALATPIDQDRFVAVDDTDEDPGTLVDKITAGTGITLDTISTPGTMIINSDGTADSFTVKADAADTTPDYLDGKVNGSDDSGITLSTGYNAGTKQVDFTLAVDKSALFDALLDQLDIDSDLYQKFCDKAANCPSPCSAPTNVQVILIGSTTTTTAMP